MVLAAIFWKLLCYNGRENHDQLIGQCQKWWCMRWIRCPDVDRLGTMCMWYKTKIGENAKNIISVAGTWTRVFRVRAEYPNHLDSNGCIESAFLISDKHKRKRREWHPWKTKYMVTLLKWNLSFFHTAWFENLTWH